MYRITKGATIPLCCYIIHKYEYLLIISLSQKTGIRKNTKKDYFVKSKYATILRCLIIQRYIS